MKWNKGFVTLLGIILMLGGVLLWMSQKGVDRFRPIGTETSSVSPTPLALTFTEERIFLNGNEILSINDFPDEIHVSADASFGSSDRITGALISPDGKWIGITVAGAAHDFGWVYSIANTKLTPVIFQYGGGVAVTKWKDVSHVIFEVTTPQPATLEKIVDVQNLPPFPL